MKVEIELRNGELRKYTVDDVTPNIAGTMVSMSTIVDGKTCYVAYNMNSVTKLTFIEE